MTSFPTTFQETSYTYGSHHHRHDHYNSPYPDMVGTFLDLYNTRYNVGAPAPHSNYTCVSPHLLVHGVTVYVPFQIPVMIFGMLVGWLSFAYLKKLKSLHGFIAYSLMFFFFGCMNFTGVFANSFFPSGWAYGQKSSLVAFLFAMGDTYCTSTVNICFSLCGLVDVGLLKEKSRSFRLLFVLILILLAIGYHITVIGKWRNGFNFLYLTTCEIGFVVYVVCALIFLVKNKSVFWKGFVPLCSAVASGLLGIKTLYGSDWICRHLNYWIGTDMIWFFFSATALLSLCFYFLNTAEARLTMYNNEENDEEEHLIEDDDEHNDGERRSTVLLIIQSPNVTQYSPLHEQNDILTVKSVGNGPVSPPEYSWSAQEIEKLKATL